MGLRVVAVMLCGCVVEPPRTFVAVTFNTGTNPGLPHDEPPDDGYGAAQAELSDLYYGDGLAWLPRIEETRGFLAGVQPDIVAFQEIFDPNDCASVPETARAGFVCESWQPGAPTVAQMIAGPDMQVMCHVGHADKCIAVRRSFGRFRDCATDLCIDGAFGTAVLGCGGGARVARGIIDRVDGSTLTLVNVHGTSGFSAEDEDCRVRQVEQVFVDLGDGAPAASGHVNLVVGDFNTDPARFAGVDRSATRWLDFASGDAPFHFISPIGDDALPSYEGIANIDHMIADHLDGDCVAADAVTSAVYFDHKPIVCTISD